MRPISNLNTSAATYIPPQQLPSSCLETLSLLVQMNNYIKRDADYSTAWLLLHWFLKRFTCWLLR